MPTLALTKTSIATGLVSSYLYVRVGLATVFSANTIGDSAINLLAISVTVPCLFVYLAHIGGAYKLWPLNILEYFKSYYLVFWYIFCFINWKANYVTSIHNFSQ